MTRTRLLLRSLSRLARCESGVALVETGLSVSFLFTILLGAVEFGRITYAAIVVSNAAHVAAQYAAQGTAYVSDCDNTSTQAAGIQYAAQNEGGWVYNQNKSTFLTTATVSYICSDDSVADVTKLSSTCSGSQLERIVSVNTTVTFDPILHLPGLPKTYNLTGSATQKVMAN
jgi:Flp pilus assembly protein TadG